MPPIIYEMGHSPFCIPVKRILDAWNVPSRFIEVSPWDRRVLLKLTDGAYYQVPIVHHDESIIHETSDDPLAVAHYLDSTWAEGELFPDWCTGIHELVIGEIENELEGRGFKLSDPFFVDTIEDPAERGMVVRHKERVFGSGCVEHWRENTSSLLSDFETVLQPFEQRLAHSRWIMGNAPVYADFALLGVIGNFEYGGHHQLDEKFRNLNRWKSDISNFQAH